MSWFKKNLEPPAEPAAEEELTWEQRFDQIPF